MFLTLICWPRLPVSGQSSQGREWAGRGFELREILMSSENDSDIDLLAAVARKRPVLLELDEDSIYGID